MTYTKDGMVIDKTIAHQVANMARNAMVNQNVPQQAVQFLGEVNTPDGMRRVLLRHAVDAVVMDSKGEYVLMIKRQHNPGAGLLALPGGFIDPVEGNQTEVAHKAALRELGEEAGYTAADTAEPLGERKTHRPFDVRVAWRDMPDTDIKKGDIFTVTTQGFLVQVESLTPDMFQAGDDALAVQIVAVEDLLKQEAEHPGSVVGIADHLDMIREAREFIQLNHEHSR